MPGHDIIAIGASAGGVEALKGLVGALPADLPAAVFVVLHTWPKGSSYLPAILSTAGPLQAQHPHDNSPIHPRTIYVAPPDYHMTVTMGAIRILKGPRENRTRPAIDPLFRSAARCYGPRVVGIVLSGTLDDGSLGLIAIKQRGGVAMVQDPVEASFSSMPKSAMLAVDADFCLPVREIALKIAELAVTPAPEAPELVERTMETAGDDLAMAVPSAFTCPECHGSLWASQEGGLLRFTCRAGHAYSAASLRSEQTDAVQRAVGAVVRALEENAALGRHLADDARTQAKSKLAAKYDARATVSEKNAKQLLRLLQRDDRDGSPS